MGLDYRKLVELGEVKRSGCLSAFGADTASVSFSSQRPARGSGRVERYRAIHADEALRAFGR